ncbi:MAG: ROK family protein [Oscillospiraceae bacterium]|nr:ROK family protein [Oscillospiraceae bacterium]
MPNNIIAIDFGGTNIKIALVEDGVITTSDSIPAYSDKGLAPRLPDTKDAVYRLLGSRPIDTFGSIGIAMPGVVDSVRGKVLALYEKYEDSKSMDLGAWCREAFGLPMVLAMDSKAALMGEMHHGCGQGFSDVVLVIFGTGIGTAVALDGKLLGGANFQAGVVGGHFCVEINGGRKCTCPNSGCIEANTGGWALPDIVREHPGYSQSSLAKEPDINYEALFRLSRCGDAVASEIAKRCIDVWRAAIVSYIHAYDPALVILSGGVMNSGELFATVTDGVAERLWDSCGHVEIRRAANPDSSVILGLYHLASAQRGNTTT